MSRRWILWFAGLCLLSIPALMPLRVAVGGLAERGFTARQVAGTIWYGRIGELALRHRRLGTFEVRLDPGPLLLGRLALRFNRIDDPEGRLDGTLVAGTTNGLRGTSGRLPLAGLFGALPAETAQLDDLTLLFRGGQCVAASGTVTLLVTAPLPGMSGAQYRGTPRCDGDRARMLLSGPTSGGDIDFILEASGAARATLRLPGGDAATATALSLAGFHETPQGWVMSAEGRL